MIIGLEDDRIIGLEVIKFLIYLNEKQKSLQIWQP